MRNIHIIRIENQVQRIRIRIANALHEAGIIATTCHLCGGRCERAAHLDCDRNRMWRCTECGCWIGRATETALDFLRRWSAGDWR